MDTKRVEDLLEKRAQALASDPERAAMAMRIRSAVGRERSRELARRRGRLVLVAASLAATLLVSFLLWNSRSRATLGQLDVQLAVLDASGRELQSVATLRGDPATFARPQSAILEVVAKEDGFLGLFLYDALGQLQLPLGAQARAVHADGPMALEMDLRTLPLQPAGTSEVSWLVVTAKRPFSAQALDLPQSLSLQQGAGRHVELDQLASRLTHELHCTANVRSAVLGIGP